MSIPEPTPGTLILLDSSRPPVMSEPPTRSFTDWALDGFAACSTFIAKIANDTRVPYELRIEAQKLSKQWSGLKTPAPNRK